MLSTHASATKSQPLLLSACQEHGQSPSSAFKQKTGAAFDSVPVLGNPSQILISKNANVRVKVLLLPLPS